MWKREKQDKFRQLSSDYNYNGNFAVRRIAQAVARKSWKGVLLNLLWTAGPVTFIAIYIGHRFGYGRGPNLNTFIYFGCYVFIVGLCTALAGIVRDAINAPKVEEEKNRLLESINSIFHLALHVRDLNLASLPKEERKMMAAYYTLQTAGPSPSAVKEAVYDLTGNSSLANAIVRVSAFDDQGMQSLIQDAFIKHERDLQEVESNLKDVAPATFDLLISRMKGKGPSVRSGRQRDEGFVQRTLDAADQSDPGLMTLSDAYEMLTLLFELFNGRKILTLDARFSGDHAIEKQKKRLDNARKKYRQAMRARNSALRLMLNDINSDGLIGRLPETASSGPLLVKALKNDLQELPLSRRRIYAKPYKEILSLHKKVVEGGNQLYAIRKRYLTTVAERGKQLTIKLDRSDLKQAGFYIKRDTIVLDDEQKIHLSKFVDRLIPENYLDLDEEQVKGIAIEIAEELDDLIHIGHNDIQSAIESSNAIQVGYLKPSFSPATKVGWARRIVTSMHERSNRGIHLLIKNLVRFYGLCLTPQAVELLEKEFNADKEILSEIAKKGSSPQDQEKLRIPDADEIPSWEAALNL